MHVGPGQVSASLDPTGSSIVMATEPSFSPDLVVLIDSSPSAKSTLVFSA
jgi:hypothetical protein